jgi:hypothetical protein
MSGEKRTVRADDAPQGSWATAAALIVFTFTAHLLVLANPGFFSHEEWLVSDDIGRFGLASFLQRYSELKPGEHFGEPVRPIGFAQLGLSTLWMQSNPVIPHAIDVGMHAVVVIVFWSLLLRVGFGQQRATWAALLFAISPLTAFAVGWLSATFERWYVLFSLICAHGVVVAARKGLTPRALALVLLGSAGAILSKETAIILPAALLVMGYALRSAREVQYRVGPALAAIALSGIPILLYLVLRWPAIHASLTGDGGPYSPSLINVPRNLLIYFAEPLLPTVVEVTGLWWPLWEWCLALALHVLLLIALWRRYGLRAPLLYVAGYFIFLVPVLPLPGALGHYLYVSGMAFAIAVTLAIAPRTKSKMPMNLSPAGIVVAGLVMIFVVARSLVTQEYMYSVGKCQAEFLASLKPLADDAMANGSLRLHVIGTPDAPEYVAQRALFGRRQFADGGKWPTVVGPAPSLARDADFVMQANCTVSRR